MDKNNNASKTSPKTSIVTERKKRKILCLDGGGLRGLVSLDILERLEKAANIKIYVERVLVASLQ